MRDKRILTAIKKNPSQNKLYCLYQNLIKNYVYLNPNVFISLTYCFASSKRLRSVVTSESFTPAPVATRCILELFNIAGFNRSFNVIEEMMALNLTNSVSPL